MVKPLREITYQVIYGPNQVEYPGRYVLRNWYTNGKGKIVCGLGCMVLDSLAECRAIVTEGKVMMERRPDDDPSIIEIWL